MSTIIIFSITDQSNYNFMHFYRRVSELEAMGKLKGNVRPCIGMYNGILEYSWAADITDFNSHFYSFTEGQETLLRIDDDASGHQLSSILDRGTYKVLSKGRLIEVTKEEALKYNGFTYRPDLNKYWVIKTWPKSSEEYDLQSRN